MSHKTMRVHVYGRVQGVFFRDSTRREALELGLVGWVKNCPDGSVETLISGPAQDVESLLAWLHVGPPGARVDTVSSAQTDDEPGLATFSITY